MNNHPDETIPKEGDTVEVLREPTHDERKHEGSVWIPQMDSTIGKRGTIISVVRDFPEVRFTDGKQFFYPAYTLRVIK